MKILGTPLDPELIQELKAMARNCAETKALVARIRATFGLEGDMHVPILAYLGRAFPVSLRVLLPLREEGFEGHYARALQVAFWLLACIEDKFEATLEYRHLANWTPTKWQQTDTATLEFCLNPNELCGRGTFRERVDKQEAFGPSSSEIRQRISNFASDLATMMQQAKPAHYESAKKSVSLTFEIEVQDKGPWYLIVCIVRVIQELSKQTQLPALQPTA